MKQRITILTLLIISSLTLFSQNKETKKNDPNAYKLEHAQIGFVEDTKASYKRTEHPDAQWFPDAGFGMFIHFGICSVKQIDLSWPMIAGMKIAQFKLDSAEVRKVMASGDYFVRNNCKNDNSCVTPVEYWEQAKYFNPTNYNPEEWAKAAKAAGMKYMICNTRHHDGFALWPSKFGNFSTKNYMGGRDLIKPYVEACRKYGLKVGLYYSGPDWYFNRDYQDFMYYKVRKMYPNIPRLDENLQVRTTEKSEAEKQAHYKAVAAYIKGQVKELLTNYGKIDIIWFDGAPDIPKGNKAWADCITMEEIHALQPGILVSPRFFGYGDFKTFEANLPKDIKKQSGWAEFCSTVAQWTWAITKVPLKTTQALLEEYIQSRSLNINYLLNFGPTKEGMINADMTNRLNEITNWMKVNGTSLSNCTALSDAETANVYATAKKQHRYLFLLTDKKYETIQLTGIEKVKKVTLVATGTNVNYSFENGKLTIFEKDLTRTALADVIDVELK